MHGNDDIVIQSCPMNERIWKYHVEKSVFAIMSIILNASSCPFTIVLNVMVIVTVKISPRLQTKYNILLACLAATDLLVGVAAQPHFIALQAQVIKGLSLTQYCNNFKMTFFVSFIPILVSVSFKSSQYRAFCGYKVYFALYHNCYYA